MDANGKKSSVKSPQDKNTRIRRIIQACIFVVIIVAAVILCINLKTLVLNRVFKAVELKPGSDGFKTWLSPPTTITRGYYLFNITNPLETVTDPASTTINLKQTPPYSYLLSATKDDIQWSDDSKSLTYSIKRVFSRHATRFKSSSVNDTGTFVDLLRAMFRTQFGSKPSPAFYAIGGNNPFYTRNAVEQLEGFTSELFFAMQDKMTGPNTAKSGLIYRYNGTRNYNFTIRSGKDFHRIIMIENRCFLGLMEKGQVLAFSSEIVPFYFSSPNFYDFTIYDGLTFVPMMFDKPSMNVYQPDFCRPINVKFNKELSMFGGIRVHEYVIKLVDFTLCGNPQDIKTCPELDKLDVSKCISSSIPDNTVFLSKPHFYGANDAFMQDLNIKGFTPKRDEHEALIYFDPYSGTPIRAHHRVQLNVDVTIDPMRQTDDSVDGLEPTKKRGVKRLLPLVWIDQEVNVDDATIRTIRTVHILMHHGIWIIMVSAVVLAIIIIGIIEVVARQVAKSKKVTTTTTTEDPTTTVPLNREDTD